MPIATIQILEGRSADKIETLIARVTQAIAESLAAPPESVRVIVSEVPKTHWGVGGQSMEQRGRLA